MSLSNHQDKIHQTGTMVRQEDQFKDTNRVWSGPLQHIMAKSYTNGILAFAGATAFAFTTDKILMTMKKGDKFRFPVYSKVLPQYRFYGWALFCLGTFQFFVEDTEVSNILEKNKRVVDDYHAEELAHIEQLERKREQANH